MTAKRGRAPSVVEVQVPGVVSGEGDTKPDHSLLQLISIQQVFDIYIPEAIFAFEAVTNFLGKLSALSEGATLYHGVYGDWHHDTDTARVPRMSITVVSQVGLAVLSESSTR